MSRYEYQVSESANADRKYFHDWREALACAKELSIHQAHPVYIDVLDETTGELANYWYTVTKGDCEKHGEYAGKSFKRSVR